jgi:hypothetical protein
MSSAMSAARSDDVSAVVILLDVNPYFWGTKTSTGFTFEQFFQHVKFSLSFLTAVSLDSELKKKALRAGLSDFTNQFDTFTF